MSVAQRVEATAADAGSSRRHRHLADWPALGAAAVFVILLARVLLYRHHAWLAGDFSVVGVDVDRALRWQQLVGVYDRFGWSHPGPAFFYLAATAERVLGPSQGLQAQVVTVLLINGTSVVGSVLVVRRIAAARAAGSGTGTAAAAGIAVALTAVGAAVGAHAIDSNFTAYVVIVPLVFLGVLAAAAIDGSLVAVAASVLVASFVVQTNVSVTALAVAFVAAGIVGALVTRRRAGTLRRPPPGRQLSAMAGMAVVVVVMWVPTVVQQVTHHPGNLTAMWRFFTHSANDKLGALGAVTQTANGAITAIGIHFYGLPVGTGRLRYAAVVASGCAVLVLAVLARRRVAVVLAALGLAGMVVATIAAASIIGYPWPYLMMWAAAPAALSLCALGVVGAEWCARRRFGSRSGRAVLAAVVCLSAVGLAVRGLSLPTIHDRSSAQTGVAWKELQPVLAAHHGQRPGIFWGDLYGAAICEGVTYELDRRDRPYSLAAWLPTTPQTTYPPPAYWILFSGPPVAGYHVVARAEGMPIYVGYHPPPNWAFSGSP